MRELLLYLFLFFALILNAQITPVEYPNLVVNGDFEEYNFCPISVSEIQNDVCVGWRCPLASTSDYFHVCNNEIWGIVGVPFNSLGYQIPKSGDAYAGFIGWNYRLLANEIPEIWMEYLEGALVEELKQNEIYTVEFYYSVADSSFYYLKNIGVSFSNISQYYNSYSGNFFHPDLINKSGFLKDTSNWNLFKGLYLAKGGEKHFIIGNYESNIYSPDTIHTGVLSNQPMCGYIYIDDVSVKKTGIILDLPNYFSPNGDEKNDFVDFSLHSNGIISNIQVFNRWGRKVYEGNNENSIWDGKHNGNDCPEGVYYYIITIKVNNEELFKANSSLMLLR